jgi:hypothetical protein
VEAQATRRVVLKNRKLVTKRQDLRLQSGTGSKTGDHQSEKSDEKGAHRGNRHDLTNDRNLCVFRWDGVFGNHNVLHATTNRQVELIDMEACGGARLISQI